MKINTSWLLEALLAGFSGTVMAGSIPPWSDGFESYPAGTALNVLVGEGWGGSDGTVVIQTNVVWYPALGTNAIVLLPSANAFNSVASAVATNVWIDFYLTNSLAMPVEWVGSEAIDSNMTVQLFVETNGYPVVWQPASNAWLVCSNDYWGTGTAGFNTNAWMRFTVCANYSNHTAAVFLNRHLLLEKVPFINTNLTLSGRIELDGGYAVTSYFDQVSVLYSPTNMTLDLDNDGMDEATELQLFGSVGIRHRPAIVVTQPQHGWIAPSNTFAVMPGSTTNFTLGADIAYGIMQVYTNGEAVGPFTGQNTRNASWFWDSIIPEGLSDGSVSAQVSYVGRRFVPQDYATVTGAMAAAVSGDTVIIGAGSYAGGVVLSNGVSLVGTNATLDNGLTVNAGVTGILSGCSGLVVSNTTVNGLLVISNGTINLGTVSFGAGATVRVINATALVVDGTTISGSFTLDASWGAFQSQTPPFVDDFERYATGVLMSQQGYFGWGADDGVVVETNLIVQGTHAVIMPMSAILSNSLAPCSSSNIWVEWNYRESGRIDESKVSVTGPDTNLTALLFVNTNGYVTVFNPEQGLCRVLSNDVWGCPVEPLTTSDWPRLTVNMNYRTRMVAVMLNGRLLVQQLRFINTNQSNCARLEWEAGTAGSTYLDALNVQTNGANINTDGHGTGISIAVEIDLHGHIIPCSGSLFLIR